MPLPFAMERMHTSSPSAVENIIRSINTPKVKATANKDEQLEFRDYPKPQLHSLENRSAQNCSGTCKPNSNARCVECLVPTRNITNEESFDNVHDIKENQHVCNANSFEASSSAGATTACGSGIEIASDQETDLDSVPMIENGSLSDDFLLGSELDPNFEFEPSARNIDCKQICDSIETTSLHEAEPIACIKLANQNKLYCKTCEYAYVKRHLTDCKQSGKCALIAKEHKWHCKGTKRTYINYTCTKCEGEYTMCPNEGCQKILKWDEKVNIQCVQCQLQNRQNRKSGVGVKLKWRWHRCLAEDCKAMYVFNRGKRLRRYANRCGRNRPGSKKARRRYNTESARL